MIRRYPLEPFRRLTGWSLKRIGGVPGTCDLTYLDGRLTGIDCAPDGGRDSAVLAPEGEQ